MPIFSPGVFSPENATRSETHKRVFARHEVIHTLLDFAAAVCFIIGSACYFWDASQQAGTWLFLVGSILFAAKPCMRLVRELTYLRLGRYDDVLDTRD